ncbi:nitrate/nitrite sensor kinase [Oleiphilus messinensis]|uniref:Sensor protein n=1 Tax=Oleiphilus messinensis TaxID=141451 RepID=A0A1Y0IEM3_9GAMM|nr:histidine kinase [Oleiphilus messinensis]ARU57814.1 nitrate/nitrite sensor kinase [Oleiphilus messinensis]
MKGPVKRSIFTQAGMILATIFLVSLIGIILTLITVEDADGDAERINIAGSMRMYTMRLALSYTRFNTSRNPEIEAQLDAEILEFNSRLFSNIFDPYREELRRTPVSRQLAILEDRWKGIQQVLSARHEPPDQLTGELTHYVEEINHFVTLIQLRSEDKVKRLRLTQAIEMLLILLIALLMLVSLYSRVVVPLRELVEGATRARKGKFDYRVPVNYDDELGQLGAAFNSMSSDLAVMYDDLEARVKEKTAELTSRNQALEYLYDATRKLTTEPLSKQRVQELLTELVSIAQVDQVSLCTYTSSEKNRYAILSATKSMPTERGKHTECPDDNDTNYLQACLDDLALEPGKRRTDKALLYPIFENTNVVAVLVVSRPSMDPLNTWQSQLLDTFTDIFGGAFSQMRNSEKEQRLLLVEERSAIARELHDSIAQSLSFLKLQITRFQMLIKKGADTDTLVDVSQEIRVGLNAAYNQLREVLTTFRIQSNEPGLEQALKGTVAEFAQRGSMEIKLDYNLRHRPPNPNEEIHILQIVREAVSNIIKHANASTATVSLRELENHLIEIVIEDNGIGISDNPKKPFHHGITIMEERAAMLKGEFQLTRREGGGTLVKVLCQLQSKHDDDLIIRPYG